MSEEVICAITPPNSPGRNGIQTEEDASSITFHQDIEEDSLSWKQTHSHRWFSCLGETKLEKINLHEDGYIKNKETDLFENSNIFSYHCEERSIQLFNQKFDFGSVFLFNSEMLFRMARSEIMVLQDAARSNHKELLTFSDINSTQDYMKARRHCVSLFLRLREYLNWIMLPKHNWILTNFIPKMVENLSRFRLFLRRLTDLPEYVLHHAAHSQGNKCQEASYHLFHCSLDMLWLHLTTMYQLERCRQRLDDSFPASQQVEGVAQTSVTLEQAVLAVVADLVQMALYRFNKVDVRSLLIKSPFNCSCVAELWILLQMFCYKLHSQGKFDDLWSFMNKVVEKMLVSDGSSLVRPNCMSLAQSVTSPCTNVHAFSLWLLKHTAMLHTFEEKSNSSNYPLLETIMRGLLNSDVPEAHLRVHLTFVERIITKYWEPKSEIIVLLWEYFQKRLNSTFFVPGSSVESMAIMSESVMGMVKQVKSRLTNSTHCDDSFQMFLRILGLHLQRVSGQTQHWNQIRGRIYSKLSPSKMQGLTEVGLYHIASLFLTLAVTADLTEVCKKLQVLLGALSEPELEGGMRRLVWRTHLSVCLLAAERGQDFTAFLSPVTSALDNTTNIQEAVALFRTYLDGLKDIIECSPCLRMDYNILIGNWIPKYLTECSQNDANRLLDTLQVLTSRVQKQPLEHTKFQSSVWQYLSPYVKLKIGEEGPLQLVDVSLSLCQLSYTHSDTLKDIIQLFLNNNSTNIGLVRRFLWLLIQQNDLMALLENVPSGSAEPLTVLIVKGWIRCSLLSVDSKNSELSRITNYVAYLPFIADICMDLPSSNDPLVHFIVTTSNKFKAAKDIMERGSLRQRMSRYLTGMDKWVEPFIKQGKSPEIVARIYHIVGLIVSLMPSFVYVKSRPNTVLKGLLDVMFLPLSAYKPDFEPSSHIKAVIAANIHLYIKGLADLGMMHDAYIDRCTEDLVRIYLPWVSGSSRCSLHECVEREDRSARLLLTAICSAFIKRKVSSPHPHCSQALRFLCLIAKRNSKEHRVMSQLVDTCFEHVCDVIMFCDDFHPCKNIAKEVLVSIFESSSFGDEISEKIIEKFGNLCRDYLPFLPGKPFSLFHTVLQHRPELVSRFLPLLQDHIRVVEKKRGISYDQSLRMYLEKLESALEYLRNGA
ncbi:protein MMS22-like isoform X2 [Homalodisca vitripennis]|uniref:protein MMS22-like isoform X2 n=1 Tax=Homalodisca vitripennis TaxID=197043 RepID=UPI001EEAD544|nr:protein MMS22-like isoform X2 [Homalodisca vitripennis]